MPIEIRRYRRCRKGVEEHPVPVVQSPGQVAANVTRVVLSQGMRRGQRGAHKRPWRTGTHRAPVAGIAAPTLDWSQDILEPQKPGCKPAAGDGPVAASHYTGKEESPGKRPGAKKPTFPTPEEQEEHKRREE